jgi:hypothetical protein
MDRWFANSRWDVVLEVPAGLAGVLVGGLVTLGGGAIVRQASASRQRRP